MLVDNAIHCAASLAEAEDVADLHRRMASAVREIGCEHFLLGLEVQFAAGTSVQHVTSGYPEKWQRRYQEKRFILVDPTIGYCQTQTKPVLWNHTLYSERSLELLEESHAHGLGHGISVPVHQGANIKSMFSLTRDKAFSDPRETALVLDAGRLLATMAHVAMQRFVVPQLLQQATPELTPRELECLRYAAQGKGSAVIADLINLSEPTVNYHLNKVMKKFGVATRMQAVAMGVQLQLIT